MDSKRNAARTLLNARQRAQHRAARHARQRSATRATPRGATCATAQRNTRGNTQTRRCCADGRSRRLTPATHEQVVRHSSGGSLAPLVPHKTSPLIGHGSSIERVVTQNVHHGLSTKAFFYKSFLLQTSRDHLTQRHVIPAAVARGPSAHPPTRAELSSRDTSAMLSCRDMSAGPRGWAAAASREAPRCGPRPAVVQGFMPPRRAAAVTGRRHGSAAGRCRRTAAVTSRRHGSAAGGCRRRGA